MSETNGNQTRPYTEDFALRDILEWSSKRPDWLTRVTMAVRVGFEPTEPMKAQRFSRPPDSTTLAPHRIPSSV